MEFGVITNLPNGEVVPDTVQVFLGAGNDKEDPFWGVDSEASHWIRILFLVQSSILNSLRS